MGGDEPRPTKGIAQTQRLHDLPRLKVADADVAHVTGGHQIVESAQRLIDGGQRIPHMGVQQIDIIAVEAAQAGLDTGQDVLAGQAGIVGPVAGSVAHLGGQHDPVTPPLEGLAGDLLRTAAGIDVGRVDKVAARVQELMDHAGGSRRVGAAPAVFAKDHGPQAQLGDHEAAPAQRLVLHHQVSYLWVLRAA